MNYRVEKYSGDRSCEVTIGVDRNNRSPRLIKCSNVAKFLLVGDEPPWDLGMIVCEKHLQTMKDKLELL